MLSLHNSRNGIISHIHRHRIERVRSAAFRYASPDARALDLGCGDGHLARLLSAGFSEVVGADITDDKLQAARNGDIPPNVSFVPVHDLLKLVAERGPFDVVVISSVLQHVSDPARDEMFDLLERCTRPGGHVIVEVPIESGPILLVKTVGGAILRRITRGAYARPTYTMRELWMRRSTRRTPPESRPALLSNRYYGHRGFSVEHLRRYVAQRLTIERVEPIPLPALGYFNLQVLFDCVMSSSDVISRSNAV
jgi:2-polyprenyl-3-methyl-5-hydroxy-6-metoxy-1,4-benzoquinol methylase